MDYLYDLNLFQQKFNIDGEMYNVLLQLFLQIQENQYTNILILHRETDGNNRLIIKAFDLRAHLIMPVPINLINDIINSIKQIPYEITIQNQINDIDNLEYKCLLHPEKIKLGPNIFILAGPEATNFKGISIELEIIENVREIPAAFVFGAFNGIRTYLYFELKDDCLDRVRNWGILSGIKVFINNSFMGEYYPQRSMIISDNRISFLCQTKANALLSEKTVGRLRMDGVNAFDIMDFITSLAGLFDSFAYTENYPKTQNWYTVVIPVTGLSADIEFGIGGVQFINNNNEEIIRIISFEEDFSEYKTFGLVHINSLKPFTAYMAAKKQIEQAIDLMVNVLKDDSIYCIHAMGKYLQNVNIHEFAHKVNLSSLIYVESPQTNAKLSCNLTEPDNENNLTVSTAFLAQKDEIEKAELLLIKANGTNDKEITPLFNSLKWIRKAWDTNSYDDKIINAIIALEFIVSKEKNVPMMEKSLRKKCKRAIEEIIQQVEGLDNKDDFTKAALEKFDRTYTETPFIMKLRNLIERLEIPISKKDMELIINAREKRNGLIHGKNDSQLPTDDIFRLCECISKIAFYKIYSLET